MSATKELDSEDSFGEGRPEPATAPLETAPDSEDGFGEGRPESATAPAEASACTRVAAPPSSRAPMEEAYDDDDDSVEGDGPPRQPPEVHPAAGPANPWGPPSARSRPTPPAGLDVGAAGAEADVIRRYIFMIYKCIDA